MRLSFVIWSILFPPDVSFANDWVLQLNFKNQSRYWSHQLCYDKNVYWFSMTIQVPF